MAKPKKTKRTQRRKGKYFYLSLALIIFAEAAFVAYSFLLGMIHISGPTEYNTTVITENMLLELMNPYNNYAPIYSITNVSNTKPILMYITLNYPRLIGSYCNVWPVLYNATHYYGYNVIIVVFPYPPTTEPASISEIQQFEYNVNQLCDLNLGSTNFIIATAFWGNYTYESQTILGYETLLLQLLNKLGINESNVYPPLLILIKPHDNVSARE